MFSVYKLSKEALRSLMKKADIKVEVNHSQNRAET